MSRTFKGVSTSQLDAMGCRQKWWWGYPMGYRPKRAAIPLELGSGIHEALEFHYGGDRQGTVEFFQNWATNRATQLGADADERFFDAMTLGEAMLEGYVKEYADKDNFEVIEVEKTLRQRIPIPDGNGRLSRYTLTARLDGLVRDLETGYLYSLEHKTYSRLDNAANEMNHQFTAQIWLGRYLAEHMGIDGKVLGVIYNGLRKQKPGPRVKAPLFHREILYRTDNEIQTLLHRAYWASREFASKNLKIYPQPSGIQCAMCDFRTVCIEKQRGGDWQTMLDMDYTKRK